MSTNARMTLIGLYNYDSTLFDNLSLPDGYDAETFRDSLLLEHGEKCVLYTDPDFMKRAIALWSSKWALELERIRNALVAEYNPIWNYDRYEEIEDNDERDLTSTSNAGHNATDSPDFNVTSENTTSAYNSNSYEPESKTSTDTKGKTQNLTESSNAKTEDDETRKFTHDAHLWGNIGVTTAASMVSEVVRQRYEYNLYGIAGKIFAGELLLGIF